LWGTEASDGGLFGTTEYVVVVAALFPAEAHNAHPVQQQITEIKIGTETTATATQT
jgi:hypothetical protein